MKTAYLSLGSNLGDRQAFLKEALRHLEAEGVHVVRRSSIYETEPQDFRDQPWFLNMAVEVEADLTPQQLLAVIQKIETDMGRQRIIPKGPRTIDLDILFYENLILKTPELEIPHPRLTQRLFVLDPLSEIAPDFHHPVTNQTVRDLRVSLQPPAPSPQPRHS